MASTRQRKRLGERIVKARKDRGWDQQTLARAAEINPGYLSYIERGLKQPSLSTLHKLRNALSLQDEVFWSWVDLLAPEDSSNGGEAA